MENTINEIKYQLEEVEPDDKEAIYQIKKNSVYPYVEKIWGWDENYQINDFNSSFFPDNFKKLVANERLIGFVESLTSKNNINISEIHIIPEYQKVGIGTSIMNQIINEGKKCSKTISVGCFKENKGAEKLYKRLGFKMKNKTETHICFEIT